MSKLNQKNKQPRVNSYQGNSQFKHSPKQDLYNLACMTLIGRDSYYESASEPIKRMKKLIFSLVETDDMDYIANLCIHARTKMNIRSAPIVMVVLLTEALREQSKTYSYMRSLVCDVIQRADQLTDMYATALNVFGDKRKVPMAIKNGVADAFNKFDEYQFGKYKGTGKQLSLAKLIRIVHPKSKSKEQGAIFEKIVKESLDIPYTWETELSAANKEKKVIWEELVNSKRLGYMATLRNLNNMLKENVSSDTLEKVCNYISNPMAVAKSKQLPYRFLSAIGATADHANTKIKSSISKALDLSLNNIPDIGDNIWIIIDCSGSMGYKYGATVNVFDIASLFAAAIAKRNGESAKNMKITLFSDNAEHVSIDTNGPILSIIKEFSSNIHGYGTNLNAALNEYNSLGFKPDTMILFSDMQVNRLSNQSNAILNDHNITRIAFNVGNYNNSPVTELNGWYQITGYSDGIFSYLHAMKEKVSVTKMLDTEYKTTIYK